MRPASKSVATIVAARIPYANAAPFYALWDEAPFAVRNLVPRELGREAEAGTVDLGLMASGDFLRLRHAFELVGPFGVAARGPVLSVLLFSRRPAAALEDALISETPETSTSIRLLRLLLDVRRGLRGVRYVRGLEPRQADALLMIGDNAMRMRHTRPEGFTHTLDLGVDWLEWTGLSFVYAVWAGNTLAARSRKPSGVSGWKFAGLRSRSVSYGVVFGVFAIVVPLLAHDSEGGTAINAFCARKSGT